MFQPTQFCFITQFCFTVFEPWKWNKNEWGQYFFRYNFIVICRLIASFKLSLFTHQWYLKVFPEVKQCIQCHWECGGACSGTKDTDCEPTVGSTDVTKCKNYFHSYSNENGETVHQCVETCPGRWKISNLSASSTKLAFSQIPIFEFIIEWVYHWMTLS